MTEDDLITVLRAQLADVPQARLRVGIGDDAAAWQPSGSNRSVISTDALIEGVHFTRAGMSAGEAGRRALAVSLSDLAAMGARPVLATIAVGVPADLDPAWLPACYAGIAVLARQARCAIAGGDVTRAPVLMLTVTVVGEVRRSNLKTRTGARPGDVLAVTGPLGASRAGLYLAVEHPDAARDDDAEVLAAYRTPRPRLAEGRWLAASRSVRALMDLSDGLSSDAARMCEASGVGAVLDTIPVHPGAARVALRAGAVALDWARDGGEDYELLTAIEPHAFRHLAGRFAARFGRPLHQVGVCSEGAGVRDANGAPIASAGWDHLR